jgi:cellulose synthase/poly-beta-1,6-N-acetylglucosamine synthase-like glycosyltransferase
LAASFWLAVAFVAYAYLGYPLLIAAAARLRPQPPRRLPGFTPSVTILLVVNDEQDAIAAKLENLLALEYPPERIEIVVVSDGSADRTDAIASTFASRGVRLLSFPGPRGKASCLNDAVPHARGELLVMTDVRQPLAPEAVAALASYFHDPVVGAVSGELHLHRPAGTGVAGVGVYWNYEKLIRRAESAFDSTVGVTGAFYALRRDLFLPLDPRTILDDVALPMEIVLRGRRVLFAPEARAHDQIADKGSREYKRKTRTLAGNYQLLALRPALLDPRKNRLFWQFTSHKLARLLVPWAMLIAFAASLWLALEGELFYALACGAQVAFFLLAALGAFLGRRATPPRLLALPYTFCMLNLAAVNGLLGFLRGRETANWRKRA